MLGKLSYFLKLSYLSRWIGHESLIKSIRIHERSWSRPLRISSRNDDGPSVIAVVIASFKSESNELANG
jgi:hypothetical protein